MEDLVISLHDLFFVVQHSMTERRKRNLDRANKVKKGVNFVLGDLVYVQVSYSGVCTDILSYRRFGCIGYFII